MSTQLSRKKRSLFTAVIISVSLLISLFAGELFLRYRRDYIKKSDHLDPDLILYDKRLGWKLAPNWKGRHRHYDFDVRYETNSYGFRGRFNLKRNQKGLRCAIVGDSFTFSLGVNDEDTFVQRLNSRQHPNNTYLNFGVPGFSTDQEYLLIQDRVLYFSPDAIFLIVYLGNDLFDNELPFPLQASHGKPYFELTPQGLKLKNTPVPIKSKPKWQSKKDLTRIVLGDDFLRGGLIARYLGRYEIFRLLKLYLYKPSDSHSRFGIRFDHAVRLFTAIVDGIRDACIEKGVILSLILMPGKSFIERPGSLSEQYQDYLRREIVRDCKKMKINVIDLATLLRERYRKQPGKWFYPNEGHLTAEGHRIVADILAPFMATGE